MAAMLIIATWPSGSGAGTEAGAARRPNVILISIDTLRADHVSAYGYARQTTPSIDRLASNGIRFANASSQSSWTLPSHISLMTSSYPHVHGVHDDDRRLGPGSQTLAESLGRAGYETAGFVSWLYVGPLFGFDRGFDRYTALIDRGAIEFASGGGARPAAAVTDAAIGFLREPRERPFFLFVHYFDPHMDYRPPKPYDELYDPGYAGSADGSWSWTQPYNDAVTTNAREVAPRDREHMEALYDGEIRYVDSAIGKLLDAVERLVGLDECLIVLVSDHGEEFDDHGSMEGHGVTHYEEVLHVPLIVRLPGRRHAETVVDEPVELIEVGPAILEELGLDRPPSFHTRSLARFWNGSRAQGERSFAYADTSHYNIVKHSIRGRRFKVIHTKDTGHNAFGVPIRGGWEIYDLKNDPREQKDLWQTIPDEARPLIRRLEAFMAEDVNRSAPVGELPGIDRELLRSLGYVE
jgi:arylsulfatase A-like enzyme